MNWLEVFGIREMSYEVDFKHANNDRDPDWLGFIFISLHRAAAYLSSTCEVLMAQEQKNGLKKSKNRTAHGPGRRVTAIFWQSIILSGCCYCY